MCNGRRFDLKHRLFITLIAATLCTHPLVAQDSSASPHFSIALGAGITLGDVKDALKYSSYGFEAAIEYGPVADLEGALLVVSLESGYGSLIRQREIDYFFTGWPPSTVRINRVPVMGWCTIRTAKMISPFVRFGAGLSWTEYNEDFSSTGFPAVRITDWGFTWGIGGGIRAQLSSWCAVSVYLDDWISTEDIAELVYLESPPIPTTGFGPISPDLRGTKGPIKLTLVGFRGSFTIF